MRGAPKAVAGGGNVIERLRAALRQGPISTLDPCPVMPAVPAPPFARKSGIITHDAADQVVTIQSGTTLADLNHYLRDFKQELPHGGCGPIDTDAMTVGSLVAYGLPHHRESVSGTWRTWVLGATVMLADGTVAKVGSRVVKSVAGYDLQRLLVGSRETLAVALDLTLRISAIQEPPVMTVRSGTLQTIYRVQKSDISHVIKGDHGILALDPSTATVWSATARRALTRYPGEWVMAADLTLSDLPQPDLMRRAMDIFDPERRLNPGAFGDA